MSYVIGVDLGTSSVKVMLVEGQGQVIGEVSEAYPLIHEKTGYSEQNPEDWVKQTLAALAKLVQVTGISPNKVEGLSFSGQMHGLVLLNEKHEVLRNAILWNDTRTTAQCREIESKLGDQLLQLAKNRALEGFTLPKILWVKENEPELFAQAAVFVLPKDYVRYRLTGDIAMDYSDAAGTLLLNVSEKKWSAEILAAFGLDASICPRLVESFDCVGTLLPEVTAEAGLTSVTKVFAGGADNACGAIGSGILEPGATMCSIGTSGVVLSYEGDRNADFGGKVHFFNHGQQDAYYAMGVTLAAGYSLQWFKETFAGELSFDELLGGVEQVPPGAKGLMFTPYLSGERTPYADAKIRASFIGMDGSHKREHFTRAVLEGITFSLKESIEILRSRGRNITSVISIGGGAKNKGWLQMQADIFDTEIVKLESEQGPAMGAAMLAAFGCGWFETLADCARLFIRQEERYQPNPERVDRYKALYEIYKDIYVQTKPLNDKLSAYK